MPLFWEKYIDVMFLIGSGVVVISVPVPSERKGARIVRTGIGVGLVGIGAWFLLEKEKRRAGQHE